MFTLYYIHIIVPQLYEVADYQLSEFDLGVINYQCHVIATNFDV